MEVIINSGTAPYFNLAAEEYFLEKSEGDVFMLWRNSPSVIIGKNQNAYAEVNAAFLAERGIPVIRRLTGGGAVFHDIGNVNFTFITEGKSLDFGRFIRPVTGLLAGFGIAAAADGRNDITACGAKISGNAQCVYNTADGRERLMHHGTLLFSSDMSDLEGALRVSAKKLESKGIKSVRSRVANIVSLPGYTGPHTSDGFMSALSDAAERLYGAPRELTACEKKEIRRLADEKYSRWEWNFGASPAFSARREARYPYGTLCAEYNAANGVIEKICITGDFFGTSDISGLCGALTGCRLERNALTEQLSSLGTARFISGSTPEDIAGLILD